MDRLGKYLESTPTEERERATISYLAALDEIGTVSPEISRIIEQELVDQRTHLKLIASENYSSYAVQLAMGNLLTDKYAEGYPHHRFYAGCGNVDAIEDLANQELKKLFNCDASYVQPHSGSDANFVATWAILVHRIENPGIEKLGKKSIDQLTPDEHEQLRQEMLKQKVMGLSLNSGGHLTHGYSHNISSKVLRAVTYDVDPETEQLDYAALAKMAKEEKPTILLAGYSAYPRCIDFAKMREIADSVGATLWTDMAHFSGLVAGKVLTGSLDPIPFSDIVTSTTHKTLRGPRGGMVLCKEPLAATVNRGCPLVLGGPLPHVMAAKAIAFKEANTDAFRTYCQKVLSNAKALGVALQKRNIRLVTGGTDNHLIVFDVSPFGLTGRQAESVLREAKLTSNRNSIPFDVNGPWYASGIRIGTPAITTLGMGEAEMETIASIIVDVLNHAKPTTVVKTGQPSRAKATVEPKILEKAEAQVKELLQAFPLYPEITGCKLGEKDEIMQL